MSQTHRGVSGVDTLTAVSGRTEGPGLFEMLQLLGKERTLDRLRAAAEKYCP